MLIIPETKPDSATTDNSIVSFSYYLQLVIYQYILIVVNFTTMSGRKQDCVGLNYDKTKSAGKAVFWATCKKCGKEKQGFRLYVLNQNIIIIYRSYYHNDAYKKVKMGNKPESTQTRISF